MDIYKIKGIHIDGIAACVPEKKVDNEEALRALYGDEASLIIQSTGIKTRYVVNPGTTSSDMCIAAAKEVMGGTETKPEEIGGIVFVTFTPDRHLPFNASLVQEKLGISKEVPAFDMNLACSGYAYGLYVASTLSMASKKKILLLDGDAQTAFTSPYDKSTVPVMADAGSATIVSYDGSDTEWQFTFYTDGSGRNVLTIPSGGSEHVPTEKELQWNEDKDGKRRNIDIYMDGFAVFRFVAIDVSRWLTKFLQTIDESADTIDSFVPHQANMYMIKKLAKKLKFPWDRTWQSGEDVGNSASATVPVTITYDVENKLDKSKTNRVLISGFGGGLSASAGLITLDPKAFYKFFHYEGKKAEEQ